MRLTSLVRTEYLDGKVAGTYIRRQNIYSTQKIPQTPTGGADSVTQAVPMFQMHAVKKFKVIQSHDTQQYPGIV